MAGYQEGDGAHSIPGEDDLASEEPIRSELVLVRAATPPVSALDLLDRIVSDPAKTGSASELMESGSRAAIRILMSIGVVLCAVGALVVVVIGYAGVGIAAGSGATGGGVAAAWVARTMWKRRQAGRVSNE